jgi:DNA-binding NarL/FixJ family response regulator
VTRVVVVADSTAAAARLEARLRVHVELRVDVLDAGALHTLESQPPRAILVLAMPPTAAQRVLDRLRTMPRPPRVVLLTPTPRAAWTARARRAGVRAVLSADPTDDELAAAVAAAQAGLLVVDAAVLAVPASTTFARDAGALTTRELEVLEMLAEGLSNRAIAARLKISRNTVKFHVAAVLDKLGARSRTEAVTLGVRQGLIAL